MMVSTPDPGEIEAVTIDFYNTLAFHRDGRGRGSLLMEYLESAGLECDPWDHQVLYDVFENHDVEYSPWLPADWKAHYRRRLASRLFERLNVRAGPDIAASHADALWDILGPSCFGVFPEVRGVLDELRSAEYPLAVLSNWQRGLAHFCVELDIADAFDHVISSAEVGAAKPDARIFAEAARLLNVPPQRILHVGDSLVDDVEGGRNAGFRVLLLQRAVGSEPAGAEVIPTLRCLPALLRGAQEKR